ncbi:GntR family transcriptional regulator [Guggenheimella bovis]
MELNQDRSIYQQVSDLIENDILRDVLLEEEQAPSTNQFARLYQINPATALKGINMLVDEGILYKKRGIGMFVSPGAKEKIIQKRKEEFKRTLLPQLLEEAKRLQISEEELIDYIQKGKK